jgi:alanyl-tRNA synthetase
VEGELLAILKDGEPVKEAKSGERVELVLPETCFYVASGGQIADTGTIVSAKEPRWEVEVTDTYRPAAGVIAHIGEVVKGKPKIGDQALAAVDRNRRQAIMRNHTATHLLHAELHAVLGEHARQAGSLVAPDRLRFDFTHSEALTEEELARIEQGVNRRILENHILDIEFKPLEQAKAEGAIALFGEKYGDTVRTVAIGAIGEGAPFSYELCGGTHVRQTGDIGTFLIISEGSAAAGIRRIEAITGQAAYELIQARLQTVKDVAAMLKVTPDQIDKKVGLLMKEAEGAQKEIQQLRNQIAHGDFSAVLQNVPKVNGVAVLSTKLPGANMDMLRQMADRFKQTYDSGVAVLAGLENGSPQLVAAVTDDLIKRGLHAGELVKFVAEPLGGSGGGRANMAQAGGKDAGKLDEALASVPEWVEKNLQPEK